MKIPVLVADASEEFGILIRHTLEETGRYQVTLTGSGAEAIEIGHTRDVRLIIIDFDLPDIAGPDCIRQLRVSNPDLAVIAIPYSSDPDDPELKDLGINGLLTKPFYLPELPQIVAEALDLPPHLVEPTPTERPTPSAEEQVTLREPPPPWLMDADITGQYLSVLSSDTSAAALLLTRGRRLWAHAGEIAPSQIQELAAMIGEFWVSEGTRGAITKFIRLSGDRQDYTLYANALVGDWILSLIYPTETPFGVIRRQAQLTAKALRETDPADYSERAEVVSLDQFETSATEDQVHEMPTDWVPQPDPVSPDLHIFKEIEIPPPEPEASTVPASTSATQISVEPTHIPGDWVPGRPRPATHLPFLGDTRFETTEKDSRSSEELPLPEAEYYLPITAILVPRFPEHQLTGAVAENLQDWVERLCLAWDWRADEVAIHPDYLSLTVSLSPETAPSNAVRRLQDDLSNRVLNTFPELARDLPSRRFWARSFLLFTGGPPTPERVHSFVKTTRRGQGLET